MLKGTLIAAFLTPDSVHLFSDGRVINTNTGQRYNRHSKVHKLSERCGLLVAGVYMAKLPTMVSKIAMERDTPYVDQIALIVNQEMANTWRLFEERESPDRVNQARAFAFIVGFDSRNRPRLFYTDNKSNPPFHLQERPLFADGKDLEMGAMSTGSGEIENPSSMLTAEIQTRLPVRTSLQQLLLTSFDGVKNILASQYEGIGGDTFHLTFRKV
jgi:hypothetical protein